MKKNTLLAIILAIAMISSLSGYTQKPKNKTEKQDTLLKASILKGLKWRSIGPAFSSGRIADFAVDPENRDLIYVAVASGNVWKTMNHGTTWEPIFDNYGSYSMADVEIDPNNRHVIWVGTGEYNSQRSVGYGDGVYKSEDGGNSFTHMGLKQSEHVGRIILDPRNSHVYVAAQGPLWGPGGDRGLYKSTDGGKTWNRILYVSENTGINDVVMDPRNPDILYASAYQRRRHVFTLINGGPEAAIYRSTDAGSTWQKLNNGLPSGDVGRIGLAISPANPDYVYAIIEMADDRGGLYRTTNRGASWEKRSSLSTASAQYYHRLFCDPKDPDKVYSMDTYAKVTSDGGKNFEDMNYDKRHVDDHAMWIDPEHTDHFLIGGDGGIYETFDDGKTWRFYDNLPVTQYYRVNVDNSLPFYYVYGGTQDNNSHGGPSRTTSEMGIVNDDWFVTNGGDGYESAVDPTNPNIVYAQAQYGYLVRYDKKSGESIFLQPQPPDGEAYRWNWNTPLIISPHSPSRLYFAANKLFRSDDRGNTWQVISPDLTRQIDRNKLKVMGKIQHVDAVAKNASTSFFGNIVSLTESPKVENLIYVGTDDGLIQVTEDAGKTWNAIDHFPGVPDTTYVSCLLASAHDPQVVYASFDAHKKADFNPYLLKSSDKGKTWVSIAGDLPVRGSVHAVAEDHVNPDLLFAGTEFGLFFTVDGGKRWIQLKNGLPTTMVPDMVIHPGECDLVIATFGRGYYILDDYSPLRKLNEEYLNKEFDLLPVEDALMFIPAGSKDALGHAYWYAPNPPVAATFSYYVKNSIQSRKEQRQKEEQEAVKNKQEIRYPSFEELEKEDEEPGAYLLFTITDEGGNVVRKLKAPASAGLNRINWDLRYPSVYPVSSGGDPFSNSRSGTLVMPGTYTVSLSQSVDGVITDLGLSQSFRAVLLNHTTLPAGDMAAAVAFQQKVSALLQAVQASIRVTREVDSRIGYIRNALKNTTAPTTSLLNQINLVEQQNNTLRKALTGNESLAKRNENQPPSISERVDNIVWGYWRSTSDPTQTMREQYEIAAKLFEPTLASLKELVERDLKMVEQSMDELRSPYTPGRLPVWKRE